MGSLLEGQIVGEVCYHFKAHLYADVNDLVERENLVMMENCRSDVLEYERGRLGLGGSTKYGNGKQ